MIGDFGGVFFGGGENKIGERALKLSERRTVDMMNDEGHASTFRGEASEDSGLTAVRVDEIGLLCAQKFFKLAQRDKIFQRMNGADEFGKNCEIGSLVSKNFPRRVFKRAFGADSWAGN